MFRYRLRTLLLLTILGPLVLAYIHWKYEHRPGYHLRQIGVGLQNYSGGTIFKTLPPFARPRYVIMSEQPKQSE